MLFIKAVVVWIVIMLTEIAHGIIRVALLQPAFGDFRARQIAVLTGSILFLAIAFIFIRWMQARTIRQLILIGLLWLGLTVAFEIGIGRMIGLPWERIGSDYNLMKGGLMPIGLGVLTFSPLLAAKATKVI